MAVATAADTVRFAQQRIAAILLTPDTWGSPEAVELQILLLLQVYHLATGAPKATVDGVMSRYRRFLATVLPGQGPILLWKRLELFTSANAAFVGHLTDFVHRERDVNTRLVRDAALMFPRSDEASPTHYEWD